MCVVNKIISIIVLTLVQSTFVLQSVCTRGSLVLIVNEDWCLKVVTLYKVSEWNPCISIFSFLCFVGRTVPLFFMFSLATSIVHLWWLKALIWSNSSYAYPIFGHWKPKCSICFTLLRVATISKGYINRLFKVKVWHFGIYPFSSCSKNSL